MLLTVIAVATLLVAVVGATFAYFSLSTSGTGATSATVTGATSSVGSITFTTPVTALNLKPTLENMAKDAGAYGKYYAVVGDGPMSKDTPKQHSIVKAELVPGADDNNTYTCTGTITASLEDTGSNGKTVATGDGAVVFTYGSGITIADVTSGTAIDLAGLGTTFTAPKAVTMTLDSDTTELEIKADVYLENKADGQENDGTGNQTDNLAGAQFEVTIDVTAFKCEMATKSA